MQALTHRQAHVLDCIRRYLGERGYPPTIRELGELIGVHSTNGVVDHLRALERKGYLTREDMKSRGLRLLDAAGEPAPPPAPPAAPNAMITVKVFGRIVAGPQGDLFDEVRIDRRMSPTPIAFGLRLTGDSMSAAGLIAGDYVLVSAAPAKPGGAVCVLVTDEAVVRHMVVESGFVHLRAANPGVPPMLIRTSDFKTTMMLGSVVGMIRKL